jgi:hypothetical protein
MQDFTDCSKLFKKEITIQGKDPNDISNWISKVEILFKNLIWNYAAKGGYLPSTFKPNMKHFSVESCELFIFAFAKYLQATKLSVGPNDNIDVLSLL